MEKPILKAVLVGSLLLLVMLGCANERVNDPNDLTLPDFSFAALSDPLIDRENIKVSVHVKIPYSGLQFIRSGERYLARYEISANIADADDNRLAGAIWSDSLWMATYQETRNTDETAVSVKSFVVPASEMLLTVRVTDLYTKKSRILKDQILQSNMYQGELSLGNIMIMDNVTSAGNNILMGQSFYEVVDTLKFKARILGKHPPYQLRYELKVKDEIQKASTVDIDHAGPIDSLLAFTIPLSDMQYANYTLILSAQDGNDHQVMTQAHFRVRLKGIRYDIGDIDEAIKQLVYIASDRQIRAIMDGSLKEKTEKFNTFWKNLDPSPGTKDNELMEEYYRRVSFSIEAFTVGVDGWRSDRGMIYILYGPPDEIQRGPFNIDQKPYQVWDYYHLGKRFVFRDRSGFGEYTLDYSYIGENDWRFNY
ncbi:MAG: GWxTD domain-containing protein [Candidatus Marinimicrobia bacterium]|nr:GWxTD domain-containing protein [Candidatus Neomarinimicrobiota bacterium]